MSLKRVTILICVALALAGASTRLSAAAFTGSTSVPSNGVTVDALHNYFSVTPLSSAASGDVDSLSLDFGLVQSARTFTSVFRVKNVSGATHTATLSLANVPQVSSVVFASSGSGSATLAAGASTTVSVTTSPLVAGRGVGTLRLALSGISWLYREYSFRLDEAPEAPSAPTAVQKPAGRLDLSWTASSTVTNLAGYDLYRSNGGGAYAKLNATPLTATTYSDTGTVDGTTYTYMVRAVSSGTPVLDSLDSTTVSATADATAPGQPTAIALANGGGAGNAYVNSGNSSNLSVSVTLPSGSLATDTVQLTVSNGASNVTATQAGSAGAGTITFTGLSVAGLGDGTLTFSARSTDLAGNVSGTSTSTAPKDTAAPGAPSAAYTDNNNAADQVAGSAEANTTITVTKTSAPTGTYSTTANASGAYTVSVAATNGKPNAAISVTYTVTARDAAGNTSSATTITFSDTR
jgi:Bacterial Ig domain